MFHPDFDYGLERERVAQMRKEVEYNRLASSLAKAAGLHRGILTRGTTFLTALFR